MGPDGIDAVIAATHEEGSTTINQQKIQQSHASRQDYAAAVSPVMDNGLSMTATETSHGGAVAPDDDFEGDIITM